MNKSRRYHPDSIQYQLLKEIEERQKRSKQQLNALSLSSSVSESSFDSGRYVSNNTQSPIHYRKQKPYPKRQLSPIGSVRRNDKMSKKDDERKYNKGNNKLEVQTQTYAEDFEEELNQNNICENEEYGGNIEEGCSPTEEEFVDEDDNEMSDTHATDINPKRSSKIVSNNSNISSKRNSQLSVKSNSSHHNNNTITPKRKSNTSQKSKLNELEKDVKKSNNNNINNSNNNKSSGINNNSNSNKSNNDTFINNNSQNDYIDNSNNNKNKDDDNSRPQNINKTEQIKSNSETKQQQQQQQSKVEGKSEEKVEKQDPDVLEDSFENNDDDNDDDTKEEDKNDKPLTDKDYETVCKLCIEAMITELIEDENEEEEADPKVDLLINTNVEVVDNSLNSRIRKSVCEVQNEYLNKIDQMPKSRRASKLTDEIEKKAAESKAAAAASKEKKEVKEVKAEEAKKVNIDDDVDVLKKIMSLPPPDPMSEIIVPNSEVDSQSSAPPVPPIAIKPNKNIPKAMDTPIMEEDEDDEDLPDEAEEVDGNKKYAQVFNDPITRAFLKAYMIKNFQEESIIFWETVKELEDIAKRITKQQRKDYCQEIYDKFIKEGSEMEINIMASQRIKITDRIKKRPGHASMFKEAKLEMEKLIVDNNYNDFLKSEFNTKAKAINDWFSVFSEFDDELKKAIAEKVYQIRGTTYLGQYFPAPTDEKQKKSNLSQLKSSYCMYSDTQSMSSFMSTSTWDSEIPSTPADLPRSIRIAGFN